MKKTKTKEKFVELPQSLLLEVGEESGFGDLMARAVESRYAKHKIYIIDNKRIKPVLQCGDRFIGNIINKQGTYWVKPVIRTSMFGVSQDTVRGVMIKENGRYLLKSTEKNTKEECKIINPKMANVGDFVSGFFTGSGRTKQFEIVKSLGKFDLNKATASLVLDKYDIPYEFSPAVIKEAANLPQFDKNIREDFTHIPFVTIDGEDSKDFDDAVFAERKDNGFHIMVAIADVAFYVKPHTELDREAYKRGNSVYLPNMVVPMLPEILSNDLCSLRPKEERAAITCSMNIDLNGNILNYNFKRAVIKSAARLNYKEVQNAIDGNFNNNTLHIFKNVIQPIYEAYFAFDKAKKARGALELESDEIKIKIDKNGMVAKVEKYEIYTSNKIIEEFMVAANVCAAKALYGKNIPIMYRIHEKPLEEKLVDMKPLLQELGINLPDAPAIKPEHFNKVLELCAKKGYSDGISNLILRLQSQAKYSPSNIGHFGLALEDYAHFTSPIRRYSDILVHRALINAYNLPDGGGLEKEATEKSFKEAGEHISQTERKAVNAERELVSRFLALYLEPSIGQDFEVKVSGVSTAGLFVKIESIGAEGLIPMRTMPDDYYDVEASNTMLVGRERSFAMGEKLMAKLVETSPVSGGMIFKYIDSEQGVDYFEKKGNNRRQAVFAKVKNKPVKKPKDKDKIKDKKKTQKNGKKKR